MKKKISKSKSNSSFNISYMLIKAEIKKNIRIIFRGPTRFILILCLILPLMYLSFMWFVFGFHNYEYPMAIVIPDFKSDQDLNENLTQGKLPNLSEFLDYLNNNSLVGPTMVKSHIIANGTSLDEFEEDLLNQDVVLIVVLPENFENIIAEAKSGTWKGENVIIELHCLNINEDFLKNIYFGFQRKLKAYYDDIFSNEIEVNYIYLDADPSRETYPRMWTLGSGAIVYAVLSSSMIIGAAFIFHEKNNRMSFELSLSSSKNQALVYTGKVIATWLLIFAINFPVGTTIIFIWLQIPLPVNFFGFLVIISLNILLGTIIGLILGSLIPEQVFTIPISVFLLFAFLFLCGGFADIELFNPVLQGIVKWIPFTYCYNITKTTIFTNQFPLIIFILGLIIYIIILFLIGLKIYQQRVIHIQK